MPYRFGLQAQSRTHAGTASCQRGAMTLLRGCSSMVEQQPSKLNTRVRFPSPAPTLQCDIPDKARWRRFLLCPLLGAICAIFPIDMPQAQEASGSSAVTEDVSLPPELQPTIASSIPALAEFKKGLFDLGYNLQFSYFADGLANPTGGVKQGAAYEGLLYMVLDADLAKIAESGWP